MTTISNQIAIWLLEELNKTNPDVKFELRSTSFDKEYKNDYIVLHWKPGDNSDIVLIDFRNEWNFIKIFVSDFYVREIYDDAHIVLPKVQRIMVWVKPEVIELADPKLFDKILEITRKQVQKQRHKHETGNKNFV